MVSTQAPLKSIALTALDTQKSQDLIISSISDENFEDMVINQRGLKLVLFNAPTAFPGKLMKKVIQESMRSSPLLDSNSVLEINTDFNQESALKYGVRSIPSLILFKDGKVMADIIGVVGQDVLISVLEKQ
eukprot:CAMPEP_0182428598 /NCGR_PEP_ID=MMETSP1167-20130531/23138_1 /TAXON_ID=2988 /ORGANISM="Mallomonas Sp, Strain CCMP3275" /LENGTH=130 /DNA_ID=CAMNT_0024611577 /DNA_START=157 /DNA_END=549 /DNA_ORIENTATION=+